jgi:hypothetical protein
MSGMDTGKVEARCRLCDGLLVGQQCPACGARGPAGRERRPAYLWAAVLGFGALVLDYYFPYLKSRLSRCILPPLVVVCLLKWRWPDSGDDHLTSSLWP